MSVLRLGAFPPAQEDGAICLALDRLQMEENPHQQLAGKLSHLSIVCLRFLLSVLGWGVEGRQCLQHLYTILCVCMLNFHGCAFRVC